MEVLLAKWTSDEENQETSAVMLECRNTREKVSLASAFLRLINCVSPASAFRHSGSLWYRWSQISPVLPSYAYWSVIMVFSAFLQLSSVKATQVCSGPAAPGGTSLGIMTSILHLKCRQITRTKAYRQSVSLYWATNIIKPICVGIYWMEDIFLIQYKSEEHPKIPKPPRTLI